MTQRARLTFRNCQVAAPLKLRLKAGQPPPRPGFPQLSSCGPIEATPRRRSKDTARRFPQLSSCGPIEAWNRLGLDAPHSTFRNCQVAAPLKHICPARSGVELFPFRNCQVAAPLKPRKARKSRKVRDFPQLSSCGPIEANPYMYRFAAVPFFPQLSSCGPIEASEKHYCAVKQKQLSATVKLRPH